MRKKKLIRNIIFIAVICFLHCYFYGYYLSREACILDNTRGLYSETYDEILVLERKNHQMTLLANFETMTHSLAKTVKIGPFYKHQGGHSDSSLLMENEDFGFTYCYDEHLKLCIVLYRVNKNIDYIVAVLENGETVLFDDWSKDFCARLIVSDERIHGTYYAYDVDDNLIAKQIY